MYRRLTVLAVIAALLLVSCSGSGGNILIGGDNFLFAKTSANFDYLADWKGQNAWSGEQLDALESVLTAKRDFYANLEVSYYCAVIPSKLNLYDGALPASVGARGQTRLEQLREHLGDKVEVIDLKQPLAEGRAQSQYILFDNTGPAINAVGCYYAYKGLCEAIPALKLKGVIPYMSIDGCISQVQEYGKTYALEIGKELKIENDTVTLNPSAYKLNYEASPSADGSVITALVGDERYLRDETARVLIQSSAVLREGIMPYFSNTYQKVIYEGNGAANLSGVMENRPDVVIDLYTEETLSALLLDPFGSAFGGVEGDVTATPLLIAQANCVAPYGGSDFIMLHGSVEPGSMVSITGTNIKPFEQICRTGKYYMGVWLTDKKDADITITAKNGEKQVSAPVLATIKYSDARVEGVIPGSENHVFYRDCMDDYFGYNTFREKDLAKIKETVLKKVDKIRQMTGKDTKVLYVVPPNPVHIYSERLPQYIKDMQTSGRNRLKEVVDYLGDLGPNCRIVDLSQTMLDHRKFGEEDYLYHLSDNHWTQYGAYLGYQVIMNNLYEMSGNEKVKPIPIDQFELSPYQFGGSDMMGELHFDRDLVKENTQRFLPKFEPRSKLVEGEIQDIGYFYNQMFGRLRFQIDDPSLPTAIMLRDSFSAGIRPIINESFSDILYEEVWQYKLHSSSFEKVKPDFVIIEFVERNIWSISN